MIRLESFTSKLQRTISVVQSISDFPCQNKKKALKILSMNVASAKTLVNVKMLRMMVKIDVSF